MDGMRQQPIPGALALTAIYYPVYVNPTQVRTNF